MNDAINTPDAGTLSEEDMAAIAASMDEGALPNATVPLLKTWAEILSNIEEDRLSPINPAFAVKMVRAWPELKYSALPAFAEKYYDLLTVLRQAVLDVIESDRDSLTRAGQEDTDDNRAHYFEILFQWQLRIAQWEASWDCTDEHAAGDLAAIQEATLFVAGPNGLVAHLHEIGIRYTEDDQETLNQRLAEALKEA